MYTFTFTTFMRASHSEISEVVSLCCHMKAEMSTERPVSGSSVATVNEDYGTSRKSKKSRIKEGLASWCSG